MTVFLQFRSESSALGDRRCSRLRSMFPTTSRRSNPGRRTSWPLLLAADAHFAEAVSVSLSPNPRARTLPHLDLAIGSVERRVREPAGPFDRLGTGLHLNDRVARDQSLRFGEWPVDDASTRACDGATRQPSRSPASRSRRSARRPWRAPHDQRPSRRGDTPAEATGLGVLRGLDDDHESHVSRLHYWTDFHCTETRARNPRRELITSSITRLQRS